METDLFRWFLAAISAVILGLIGVVWSMRKGELDRRDGGLLQEIHRLDEEIKGLRKERHDNTETISTLAGRCSILEDDMNRLRSQRYVAEQLRDEIRKIKDNA